MRIKDISHLNRQKLPESTPDNQKINYIQIGDVRSDGKIEKISPMHFGEAPVSARRVARNQDTIVSMVRTYLRAITTLKDCPDNTIVSTAFTVLTPHEDIDPRYLGYFMRDTKIVDELNSRATGVTYPTIKPADIANLHIQCPDLKTQRRIANFLDAESKQTRRIGKIGKTLIKRLKERRTAVISNHFTKFKDHIPLKFACKRSAIYGAGIGREKYEETGIRFLRTTDINDWGKITKVGVYVDPENVEDYILENGDILLSRSGTLGRCFIYDQSLHEPCAYAGYLVRFQPAPILNPHFFYYWTKTSQFQDWIARQVASTTIGNVNAQKYGRALVPLPVRTIQDRTVNTLRELDNSILYQLGSIERLIGLTTERLNAILTATISGKHANI